jgi:hypothetical protein
MIKRLFFFILLILIIFSSCVAKKTTTEYKEVIKRDSTYHKEDRIITPKVVDTLYVKEPCDSITGKLKDFEKEIVTPQAKVKLRSVKGDIEVVVDIEAIVQERIREYKLNYKAETQIKEVETVIFRTPLWVWLIILIEGLIIFLLLR